MKQLGVIFILFISNFIFASCWFETDSISPPPYSPQLIAGDTITCVGETNTYIADIPVSCNANWYINGNLQTTPTDDLIVTWTNSGTQTITLEFTCDTITYTADSLSVTVNDTPNTPANIVGATQVCNNTTEIYTTVVDTNETCQWIVDGIIQISHSSSMSYYWTESGMHNIKVRAINDCGLSNPNILDVIVFKQPTVVLGNDTTIIQGETIVLDAGNPNSSYLWSTGDTSQTISVSQIGVYFVDVTNACGNATDTIVVDVVVSTEKNPANDAASIISYSNGKVFINANKLIISKIMVWNINGKLIINSNYQPYFNLPYADTFILTAISTDGKVYRNKFVTR